MTTASGQVLGSKCGIDLLRRNIELRHFLTFHLDIHHLRLITKDGDALHILDLQELPLQELGKLIDFPPGVSLSCDCKIDAKDITKIIINDGRAGTRRQPGLTIINLATQFIPDLG